MGDSKTAAVVAAADPMLKTPDALQSGVNVTLGDGSTIRVLKWSWAKFKDMIVLVGNVKEALQVAEMSVAEEDRERVRNANPEDIMEIAAEAARINVTPKVMRNFPYFLEKGQALGEAITAAKSSP